MDRYGQLSLSWCIGYKGTGLHFVTDDILVYACGNSLTFIRNSGGHVRSIQSEGSGVGAIAVNQKNLCVAYAEKSISPKIFIIDYPMCSQKCAIEGGAALEYKSLEFSGDGKTLLTLSGVPDFKMTLWDVSESFGMEIHSVVVGADITQVSMNPLNWKQIFSLGPSRITLWTLEQCGREILLTPVDVTVPEKTAEVGTETTSKVPPPNINFAPPESEIQAPSNTGTLGVGMFVPPNMSEVLYKESYEEFIREKELMELKSFCWTPRQSLYVGCTGGQLLSVEFDAGSVRVLVNSLPAMEEESCSSDKSKDQNDTTSKAKPDKTVHSLLKEGALDCIFLSRKGLFVAGRSGVLQCFDVTGSLELLEEAQVSNPIQQLCFSPSCSKLALGCTNGAIFAAKSASLDLSLTCVSNHLHSALVGLGVLCPGTEHCVTCRKNGIVQVWDVASGSLLSTLNLDTECCSLTCPLSCKAVVVGTASGHLCFTSFLKMSSPKLLEKRLMHEGPVQVVRSDQAGIFMLSASTEGPVFFYSCKPSTKFEVLGYIELTGATLDISLLSLDGGSTEAAILSSTSNDQREITTFHFSNADLEQKKGEIYMDLSRKFSSEFLQASSVKLDKTNVISTMTLIPENRMLSILDDSMELAQFSLPLADQEPPEPLKPISRFDGHETPFGKVAVSFHRNWSCSVGSDGKLLLRLVATPNTTLSANPYHYQDSDNCNVIFTHDSQAIITTSDSGAITCWTLMYSDYGHTKSTAAIEYHQKAMMMLMTLHSEENEKLKVRNYRPSPTEPPESEKTWFTLAKEEACKSEDDKYSESKDQLKQDISSLRSRVLEMIAENETLPGIEKLERQEFILDTEDYQRMLGEEETLINQVREEIELSNLAAMFLREQIKRECWDKMLVKGRTIQAFQNRTEVNNYPLMGRSEAGEKEFQRIKVLRNIDIAEKEVRKKATEELRQTLQPTRHDDILDDEELLGDIKERQSHTKEEMEEPDTDPSPLLGSDRTQYGGSCELLVDQFQLHSQVFKKHQITLLENCIFLVKECFNKEFDDVLRAKVNEIARIKEKNLRISKIINQLKLREPIVQPTMSVLEEPERLLVVEDSELEIERYVSPQEQKAAEEAAKLEEEKRLAAMGDNPRERALDMMMGGRLEANVEDDLFKDLPRPDFMSKNPTEMTEEEIRMAREFERKEEAFLEEREKMRKALEAELRKLQSSIIQGMEQFDERLQKLFQMKIRTQMAIHEDELQILHLARSLLIERETAIKLQQVNEFLQERKVAKIQLGTIVSEAKVKRDEVREHYDLLAAEDKEMDRTFKKDFADCEPHVDQLYKLFRKRPRGQRHKSNVDVVVGDPNSLNLFAVRPSSSVNMRDTENPMGELDSATHMPEGLEPHVWERFVLHRHKKVESEGKVRSLALELAEINAFLQKRQNEESRVQQDIQNAFKDINKLQEDKVIFDLNLEIQFLLKQGQVEVEMEDFIPDFSNSVLVHRSRIEELNSQIKTLGESKLNNLMECKDFKRGIRMLEWERRKMELEEEGLLDKARDIQMMRVTRDLLQRLHEKDLFSKDTREKETLDSTIEFNKKTLKKMLREKNKALKDLLKQVKGKSDENKELDRKLRELQVSVAERAQIEKLADVAPSEKNRERRMQEIVMRRQLVETIKEQDEEYSILKVEMERLRMKTFPALVQVD